MPWLMSAGFDCRIEKRYGRRASGSCCEYNQRRCGVSKLLQATASPGQDYRSQTHRAQTALASLVESVRT